MVSDSINYVQMAGRSAGPAEDTSVLCGSHQNFITFLVAYKSTLTVYLLMHHIVSELHLTKATRNLNVPYTHAEA